MSKIKIVKSAFIISAATALSRVFGYARDLVMAFFFGTGTGAQAFIIAFKIPNLLRYLVGEGAVSAALVPVFSEYLSVRSEEEFKNLAAALFSIFCVVLIMIVTAGILFAPFIVKLIAPGFLKEVDLYKFTLTVTMTRVLFPYILLIGLGSWCMGILHSYKIFAPSSFGPALLNIVIIGAVFSLRNKFAEPALSLAVGALVGGAAQLAIQLPPLVKKGIRLRFVFHTAKKGVQKVMRLLLPRVLGAAVYQLNILVDSILASFAFIVGEGAVAALHYSNRIIQLPMGIFVVALSSAILPSMSVQAIHKQHDELKDVISFSLRGVFFLMVPVMAGLFVLVKPVTVLLFERGVFGGYSTGITASALFFYSFGLFAYAGTKILSNGFYAMQDTRTPVKAACISLIVNVILNLILMWKLKVGGLALATSISGIVNFSILFYALDKRLGRLDRRRIAIDSAKICAAALVMGVFCYFIFQKAALPFIEHPLIREIFRMLIAIIASMAVFAGCVYALKLEQMRALIKWILKRK
ncbi:MAG: murein biosynthesis integral membrane protein MurJ [Candidatus Omnitrophota bacterium]